MKEEVDFTFLENKYSVKTCAASPVIYSPMLLHIFILLSDMQKTMQKMLAVMEGAFGPVDGPVDGFEGAPDISVSGTSSGTTV